MVGGGFFFGRVFAIETYPFHRTRFIGNILKSREMIIRVDPLVIGIRKDDRFGLYQFAREHAEELVQKYSQLGLGEGKIIELDKLDINALYHLSQRI